MKRIRELSNSELNTEFNSISNLVKAGVWTEFVDKEDEEELIKYLERIYASIDINIKVHFSDPTDLIIDKRGIVTVPLTLKGLKGLYKQFLRERVAKDLEAAYPGITDIFNLLHKNGYLTRHYTKQDGVTGAELKLAALLTKKQLNKKIPWPIFKKTWKEPNLDNFDLYRCDIAKQEAVYKLFPAKTATAVREGI